MAKSFHSALLLFSLVAMMELVAEASVCTRDVGACSPSCNDICASKYPKGGKGACQGDQCVCFFECGTEKRCEVALGLCSAKCYDKCCAAKCAQKGPLSQAFCDDRLSPIVTICRCSYDCS